MLNKKSTGFHIYTLGRNKYTAVMSELVILVKANPKAVIWKAKTRLVAVKDKLSRLSSAIKPLILADKQMGQNEWWRRQHSHEESQRKSTGS